MLPAEADDVPGRCILCGGRVDGNTRHIGTLYAHVPCLEGQNPDAITFQEILAAVDALQYGEVTIKVHGGHIDMWETKQTHKAARQG